MADGKLGLCTFKFKPPKAKVALPWATRYAQGVLAATWARTARSHCFSFG